MEVHDAGVTPVPKDRVVMVIDMTDEVPLWEFAHWLEQAYLSPEGLVGGWCVADHETLRYAVIDGTLQDVASSVFDEPTHWADVPALPAVAGAVAP